MEWLNKVKTEVYASVFALGSIFAPTKPLLLAVGALVLIDTVTGIIASKKGNQSIESRKFSRVTTKILIYHSAILTGFLLERFILGSEDWPISKWAAGYCGLTEMISVLENLSVINGKPLFNDLIKKLKPINDKEEK